MTRQTTLILVRHGQTPWNPSGRLRGRAMIPLDDYGLRQAGATGQYVAQHWALDAIYASPLRRTLQTADQIAMACGTRLPILEHDGLLDIDFGLWTGIAPDTIQTQWPEAWARWQNAPQEAVFPDGESLVEASDRAIKACNDIRAQHKGQTVAIVSHTAINRLIMLRILDSPLAHFWHIGQDTCAINLIECEDDGCAVRKLNLTHHLENLT